MFEEILKVASTQGVWATLCIGLIFYILKNQEKRDFRQEKREEKYQEIISILSNKLSIVDEIKSNVEDIKEQLFIENKSR